MVISPHPPYQSPYLAKGNTGFCYIQYDHDSLKYYWNGFGTNDGIAVYMDPAMCGADSVYPFKITNVHFYLYDFEGALWPVDLKVNIRQARAPEDSIKTPGEIIFTKAYTIPSDSGYVMENPRPPINLTLDTDFYVSSPFFLELMYTNLSDSNCASLIMSDSTDQPDTNQDWLVLKEKYSRWDTAWVAHDMPGRAVMRVTGYPQAMSVAEEETNIPGYFELLPNYPNPFNNQTVIKYTLSKPVEVSLTIYNILGQKVRTLVKEKKQSGTMSVAWNGKDDSGREVSSGIYFYRLKAGEYNQTRRMVLLK